MPLLLDGPALRLHDLAEELRAGAASTEEEPGSALGKQHPGYLSTFRSGAGFVEALARIWPHRARSELCAAATEHLHAA